MADTARLRADLRTLVGDRYQAPGLSPRGAATPIPAGIGAAALRLPGIAQDAAEKAARDADPANQPGIASPLSEPSHAARTYHADKILTTSDGVFTLIIRPIKSVALVDAVGRSISIGFAAPP